MRLPSRPLRVSISCARASRSRAARMSCAENSGRRDCWHRLRSASARCRRYSGVASDIGIFPACRFPFRASGLRSHKCNGSAGMPSSQGLRALGRRCFAHSHNGVRKYWRRHVEITKRIERGQCLCRFAAPDAATTLPPRPRYRVRQHSAQGAHMMRNRRKISSISASTSS